MGLKMARKAERNVIALGIVSFLNDVGSDMIFPILPLFIVGTLGAPAAVLGLIEGIANSTSSVLKLFSGELSDRLGKRKALVATGYSISAVTKPLFSIASAWPHVLTVRFVERLGKGIRTAPRDALLAESVKMKKRGGAFGLRQALDSIGSVIGALFAAGLLALAFGYREIFMLAFIPSALAVVILILFVKEVAHAPLKKLEFPWKIKFPSDFKKFMLVVGIFNVANFSYAFFLLRAQEAGLEVMLIPLVYLVYMLFYALLAYPAGKLSDRIGRKRVIGLGYGLFALTAMGFMTLPEKGLLWPLFALYGVQIAFTDSVSRSFTADLVKRAYRGTAMGAYHMTVGLAALPASLIAGLVWDLLGSETTFGLAASLAVLALLLLTTIRKG